MIVHFYDRQDELNPWNGSALDSPEKLLRIVDSHLAREPFFAELVGDNGFKLLVGLGGVRGCVQYGPTSGDVPYLVAIAREPGGDGCEFLIGGTATPVAARYSLPIAVVRNLIRWFAESGGQSPEVEWEPT